MWLIGGFCCSCIHLSAVKQPYFVLELPLLRSIIARLNVMGVTNAQFAVGKMSLSGHQRPPASRAAITSDPISTASSKPSHFQSDAPLQFPVYWVETRTKPCFDGLKTESGMGMVFNVPSPVTLE